MWITWHISQRSRSLSKDLNMPILEYVNDGAAVKRHVISSLYTIYLLVKHSPSIVCIQYSFMLLIIAALYKILTLKRVVLVCDCHTKALRRSLSPPLASIFNTLKSLSFKYADIGIISNDLMQKDIQCYVARYFILPDRIPDLKSKKRSSRHENYCVFVGSFAVDEPLDEVIKAAGYLKSEARIYCTGKIPERLKYLRQQPYDNILFTDYVSDDKYVNLISDASCIIALTTEDGCLQCAGYEAMALNVPLVVSDTNALSRYFEDSVIYVDNTAENIAQGVRQAMHEREPLMAKMERIKSIRKREYEDKLAELCSLIGSLT